MVQRETKPKPDRSIMVEDREIAENRDGVVSRKSVEPADHWAFLDKIEAPMWVDLNQEASSGYNDNDDEWFQISHPFHQCSSRQLISVFPHVGEGNANSDFRIREPSSPKLPPSISRSRGKQYRSREWGQTSCGVVSNKPHPVKNLSSKSKRVNLGSGQNIKAQPSDGYRKGNTRSKATSVCESNLTETSGPNYQKPSSSVGDSNISSSSGISLKGENKSASTIMSESSENKHQKLLEVSSHTVSHTSGLLSALKITLRKSCVTRQASRVEIVDGRQSEGSKSSSAKSSVGSSSHRGYDVKNTTRPASQNKDVTPDSRNVMRGPQATKEKVKVSIVPRESTAKTRDLTSKSRWGSKTIAAAKPARLETGKSKVVQSKAMRQHGVNEQDSATIATKAVGKVGVNKFNRLGDGKENAMSQRSNTRGGSVVPLQQVTKQIAAQKSDKTELNVPKGKISARSKWKSSTNAVQKVYFR